MERGVQAIVGYPDTQFILRFGSASLSDRQALAEGQFVPLDQNDFDNGPCVRQRASSPVIQSAPQSTTAGA
jgi:hypothetical protein